jgi:precorrin-6B methylase 2
MKTLKQICEENNMVRGNMFSTDKEWINEYISRFYEECFAKFTHRDNLTLLEIGVYHGGSLFLWSEYFPNGMIYGIDSKDKTSGQLRGIPNVRFIRMDAYNEDTIKLLPEFDIIIDDGDHVFEHQEFVIRNYYKKLKADSILIVEDVLLEHTEALRLLALESGYRDSNIVLGKIRNLVVSYNGDGRFLDAL